MSRITHAQHQSKTIYYWDYYILCRLNVAAAMALQRMEYWDGTKATAIIHAEAYNDALQAASMAPTQDISYWVYKAQDELQWELMGITGEKGVATLLKFLQEEVQYLACRHNPHLPFDRKKQYEFQVKRVQEHLDYLNYITDSFRELGYRQTPVAYAIELLTREHIYIEHLSVSHVMKKLDEMQADTTLPKFLKLELAKEKTQRHQAPDSALPFRSFAEWKQTKLQTSIGQACDMETAKLRNGTGQACGMETAEARHGWSENAESTPQERGSNSSNYHHLLQTVTTTQRVAVLEPLETTTPAATHPSLFKKRSGEEFTEEFTDETTTAGTTNNDSQQHISFSERASEHRHANEEIAQDDRTAEPVAEPVALEKPAPDAPRKAETVIALVEFLRGMGYLSHERTRELRAAQRLLALQPALSLAEIEEAWLHGSDDYWRETHEGDDVYVHDLMNKDSHGKQRVLAFLAHKRAQERQTSLSSSGTRSRRRERTGVTTPSLQPVKPVTPPQPSQPKSSLSQEQAHELVERIAQQATEHGYTLHGTAEPHGDDWIVRVSWQSPAWRGDLGLEIQSARQWEREFHEWQEVILLRTTRKQQNTPTLFAQPATGANFHTRKAAQQ